MKSIHAMVKKHMPALAANGRIYRGAAEVGQRY